MIRCCPKCGGFSGIDFTRWEQFSCCITWHGEDLVSESTGLVKEPKHGKCRDCGHIAKIEHPDQEGK